MNTLICLGTHLVYQILLIHGVSWLHEAMLNDGGICSLVQKFLLKLLLCVDFIPVSSHSRSIIHQSVDLLFDAHRLEALLGCLSPVAIGDLLGLAHARIESIDLNTAL